MSNRTDWVARIYDENDEVITVWFIEDRTEKEARDESEADVTRLHPGRDWTLSKAEEMDGGQIEVKISGSVWIKAHTEAAHDVLWHAVRYAILDEWDTASLERAIENAVRAHLAVRGVTDIELDAFEDHLYMQGQELVEIEIDVK